MWTVLIFLASATFAACTETTVHATAGEDVLLHCDCPRNEVSPYLVWQIGDDTVVDEYSSGHVKSNISPKYLGRTEIFLSENTANCSLLIRGVTTADEDTYTCHYYSEPVYTSDDVTLRVSERFGFGQEQPPSSPPSEPEKSGAPYAIGGVVISVALLLIVVLTVMYRRRRLRSNVTGPPEAEQMEPLEQEMDVIVPRPYGGRAATVTESGPTQILSTE